MITDKTLDAVHKLPIEDVIGEYVSLQKKGRDFLGICPFHEDKSPSLHVTPGKDIYKCFACGEGGHGGASFVMKHFKLSYPEAIKKICQDRGIPFEEVHTYDSKQEELVKRKEAMLTNFLNLQDFFTRNLKESPEAVAYVGKRWSMEMAEDFGIGYAPQGNKLLEYAQGRFSLSLLKEMGMLGENEADKSHFDFFRYRIMIPIRDYVGHVVAYTARIIQPDYNGKAKYLNNPNSPVYAKNDIIFNLDRARLRLDKKKPMFYAVEGAPDVLKLIMLDVHTAVATLGAQWTEKQLLQLQRFAKTICFIPDSDPPKENGEMPPGLKGVIASAKLATKMGFACFIKELPLGPDNTKNDADSYFNSRQKFDALEEQDFVTWYAALSFKSVSSPRERSAAIHNVAEVIGSIEDRVLRKQFVDLMSVEYDNADLWTQQVRECADQAMRDREKIGKAPMVDTQQEYGFGIDKQNYYFSVTDKGGRAKWSNFILVPLWHIRDDVHTVRIFRATNTENKSFLVEMKQNDLLSLTAFRMKMAIMGNFVWFAKEEQLVKLTGYLYANTPTADPVHRMGWQKRYGFYAFGNGVVYGNAFIKANEQGMVTIPQVGTFYFPAASEVWRNEENVYFYERNFFHRDLSGFSLNEYATQLIKVFGDNGKVGLTFVFAAIFRDIIVAHTDKFPILNIFGQKNTGKTELAVSLMAFFLNNTKPDNLNSTTLSAAGRIVARCCNAMVHFDEYKNSLNPKFIDFFKGLWDRTGRTLSNKDDDKKSESTAVDTAVVITGQEMPNVDIALFTRLIYLANNKSTFTNEEQRNMTRLKELRSTGCSHLTVQLLAYRSKVENGFRKAYEDVTKEMQDALENDNIIDRIIFNWRVILAIDRVLNPMLNLPYSSEELFSICIAGLKHQNATSNKSDEIASFWDAVQFMYNKNLIFGQGDFRIDLCTDIKCDGLSTREFPGSTKVLKLRYKTIFPLYYQHCRSKNIDPLPEASLSHYLTNGPAYLGKQKSVRFKKLNNMGFESPIPDDAPLPSTVKRVPSTIDQAFCFNYEELHEAYGINLESMAETATSFNSDKPS